MKLKKVLATFLMCLTMTSTVYAVEYVDNVGDSVVAEEFYNAFMNSESKGDIYLYNKSENVGRLNTNYRLDTLRTYLELNYLPSGNFSFGSIKNTDGSRNIFLSPLNDDFDKLYNETVTFESRVKEIVDASLHYNMSDREKAMYFNYRLLNACKYDRDEDKDGFRNFTAYGALIDGVSVCDGYAKAFYKLCTEAGLPCRYIIGTGDASTYINHAWNAVYIDGEWLYVDCTWNDNEDKSRRNKYLLISKEEMERTNHTEFYYFENDILKDIENIEITSQ